MKKIWVVGSSNVDLIMKMPRLPALGETVTNAEFMQTFGGKGTNSAVGAARAGGNVVFVNAVGDDPYAPALLAGLEADGIDTRHVLREKDIPSGHALVMIGEGGANYLSVAPGANHRLTPQHIDALESELAGASRILIQNEIPAATNRRILDLAARHAVPVQWNFAPCVQSPIEWLREAALLIVNESEAEGLARQAGITADGYAALADALLGLCPRGVLITLGADGVQAATPGWKAHLPAFAVEAIDTTGAGDIFCGSLATALVEGLGWPEAIRFASAASAISVGRLGAQPSAPTRSEIDQFLQHIP
ncbi:MAG: ribokinase [Terrimicrobiaceae bacterium]